MTPTSILPLSGGGNESASSAAVDVFALIPGLAADPRAFAFRAHALNSRATLNPVSKHLRRGGRVVECTALEMRHTGNRIGGSNPSLSANQIKSVS
jgi:hypothetical protein